VYFGPQAVPIFVLGSLDDLREPCGIKDHIVLTLYQNIDITQQKIAQPFTRRKGAQTNEGLTEE